MDGTRVHRDSTDPSLYTMKLTLPFILASQSPRRKHLLDTLGLSFCVVPSTVDEIVPPHLTDPVEIVEHLASLKAQDVAKQHPDALTLGADTLVVLNNQILGKPNDPQEARSMLKTLSGVTHTVYTGLALLHPTTEREMVTHEATAVSFASLSDAEIEAYVATGSPLDKAGAYGIQEDLGAVFVSGIRGDYYNVVGLPLHRLYRILREHFADLLAI